MIYGLEQHKWGTWNLWNLFPHNYPYIPNLLYYISNLDLCRFCRFYTGKNIKGLMKCLGKGSPGSKCDLPIKISADAPLTPILHLGRRNASRVPALACGWKNLLTVFPFFDGLPYGFDYRLVEVISAHHACCKIRVLHQAIEFLFIAPKATVLNAILICP